MELLEWCWALNVGQDRNLWARGGSTRGNMCLRTDLRKGPEVGYRGRDGKKRKDLGYGYSSFSHINSGPRTSWHKLLL